MTKSIITLIECYFKMPFNEVINTMHIKQKISLNQLSKMSGISRQSITNAAKRLGLKTRNIQQATKLTINKGNNHYKTGKNKNNCMICKESSIRMIENNPSKNNDNLIKRAITISRTFRANLQPQEIIFRDILNKHGINFEMQLPVDRYNLDFFIPHLRLAIEIDSTNKWGRYRYKKANERDFILLNKYMIKTLRINKKLLSNYNRITNILKTNNIIS